MPDLDLLIIGTGSGNSILNDSFDGMKVGMVERDVWGGTCLNRGCIPSKMLVLPADRITEAAEAADLDVDLRFEGADWTAMRDRIFGRIDPIADGGRKYRVGQDHVEVFEGDARFVGPRRITVDGVEVTAERIVVAAGAHPNIPPVPGLAGTPFHTSDTIMRIDEIPRRLVILGGGFIAAELGYVFASLGSHVSVIHRGDRMLRHDDVEVSVRFTEQFAKKAYLHLNAELMSVSHDGDEFTVQLDCQHDCHRDPLSDPGVERAGTGEFLRADALLVAAGRTPNGHQLEVGSAGVTLDADGYIVTDPMLRTSAEGVWALGDIRSHLQLKHIANRDARVVQHNLLHPDDLWSVDDSVVPRAVFSHPQVGAVGKREIDLQAEGRPYVVGRRGYGGTAYGWALEDTASFAKVLVDPGTLQLLGAHVIGPQAATLVQQMAQAMTFRVPVDELAHTQIWLHPGLAEVLENALLDALKHAA